MAIRLLKAWARRGAEPDMKTQQGHYDSFSGILKSLDQGPPQIDLSMLLDPALEQCAT
jgi:hypothetical protein